MPIDNPSHEICARKRARALRNRRWRCHLRRPTAWVRTTPAGIAPSLCWGGPDVPRRTCPGVHCSPRKASQVSDTGAYVPRTGAGSVSGNVISNSTVHVGATSDSNAESGDQFRRALTNVEGELERTLGPPLLKPSSGQSSASGFADRREHRRSMRLSIYASSDFETCSTVFPPSAEGRGRTTSASDSAAAGKFSPRFRHDAPVMRQFDARPSGLQQLSAVSIWLEQAKSALPCG